MSVLILHGIENHRPPQHWQFQLAAELVADGVDVRYPQLPDPDEPSVDVWRAAVRAELATLGPAPTVVCHSLACALWLSLAPAVEAGRALLVAPPADSVLARVAPAFRTSLPPAGVINGAVWASDDDPYNPDGAAVTHAGPLELPLCVVPSAGHFTPADGYGRWPEVAHWVRSTSLSSADASVSTVPAPSASSS